MPKGRSKTPSSGKSLNLIRSLGQRGSSGEISAQHYVHIPAISLADWAGSLTPGLLPPRRPVDIPLLPQPPEFIEAYKTTYRIKYRIDAYRRMEQLTEDIPDEFQLLTSAYVGQFIKRMGRSRLKLRSDVTTDTILTDLGHDLLSDILAYTECHWYA
ncbi:hypothetical protein BGZ82_003315 [Podila clonocystis]|nr:hypothetical protein BGZ82_003315 [Podila clonocystis]